MGALDDFRARNPAYKDTPDDKLSDGLYNKFYASKMSREEFNTKIGGVSQQSQKTAASKQSMGSELFQGAGDIANKATDLMGKAGQALVPDAYRKATQAGAEAIAGGVNKVAGAVDTAGKVVPGLDSYKKAVETVKAGMLNPEQTKNPETTRNIKAAWDLIQAAGGAKAMIDMGLTGAKAIGKAGSLASKGAETVANKIAPDYMKKVSDVKAADEAPVDERLKAIRNKQYGEAENSGTKYNRKLSDSVIQKAESKIEGPRGENEAGLNNGEQAELDNLKNNEEKLRNMGNKPQQQLQDRQKELEEKSEESGLSTAQSKKNAVYKEYSKLYKENPITSFSGLRSLEREISDKIAKEINPATHSVSEEGKALLDVRTHLHDLYLDPNGKNLVGSPKGIKAHLAANKTYSQEIKARNLKEAKMIGAGDANAERAAYRAMYKRALKQRQFWSEPELEELRKLGQKSTVLKKMIGGAIAHKTMGLSKLLPESAIDTTKLENLLLRGQ